jgi:hypothetical protein
MKSASRNRDAFTATFVATPGTDGLKAFRALLKSALRRFGLRAIDVRECTPAPDEQPNERTHDTREFFNAPQSMSRRGPR